MQSYDKPQERPDIGVFYSFDHVKFHVSNAKQTASWYTSRFGFEYYAYQGLETGNRDYCTHVVKNGNCMFAFISSLKTDDQKFGKELEKHGDGAFDVAFNVDDCIGIYNKAVSRGAKGISEPQELKDDNGGSVVVASVQTYGDTIHTFVQRKNFKGVFLPGFKPHHSKEKFNQLIVQPVFSIIDHVVGNQPEGDMVPVASWYEKMLDFHRFWSVDESVLHTEYSALRSIVVTDFDEHIKMPINEPAPGKRKSQIQEYVDFYGGAGVQHIALLTPDIITTIQNMTNRGVEFLDFPDTYYELLQKRLANASIQVKEDLQRIRQLKILVDYDDKGYLLQIFTKPVEDRPTLFYEIIQRHNHQGFGAGNFKSLFESIELEQGRRGNL